MQILKFLKEKLNSQEEIATLDIEKKINMKIE